MEIKQEVLDAAESFYDLLEQLPRGGDDRDCYMDLEDLKSIEQEFNNLKIVDDFFKDLSKKGELKNFYDYAIKNLKINNALKRLITIQIDAYMLSGLLSEFVEKNLVADCQFAYEILLKGKFSELAGNQKISSSLLFAFQESCFSSVDKNGEDFEPTGIETKLFREISKDSSLYKNYESLVDSIKTRTNTPWDLLIKTSSVVVIFDEKSSGIYDVSIMVYLENATSVMKFLYQELVACFLANEGVIHLGEINENLMNSTENSETLNLLLSVLVQFKQIYFANTGSLYTNEFLATVNEAKNIKTGISELGSPNYS